MSDFSSRFCAARRACIARDFAKLNPEQRRGALTTEGPLLLLAGAGSGKTTVLINRIANLLTYGRGSDCGEVPAGASEDDLAFLENYPAQPTADERRRMRQLCAVEPPAPWQVFAVTFTNKASKELRERLEAFGIAGAALATVLAQYVSAVGILLYVLLRCRMWLPSKKEWRFSHSILKEILNLSSMTCIQQSVMNFGILMVQGLVNSFGPAVMAAFAAAVKIDTFAYLPVQDFGNAYSTFTAQNYGAGNHERIRRGTKDAFALSAAFSIVISLLVNLFAHPLMQIFVKASEMEVIAIGIQYLRLEGSFYLGIGWLFLLYGYYRAVKRAEMSVVLTVISLGMRVALAYLFSATALGVAGIWIAIPIGWTLADMTGLFFLRRAFRSQKPA